MSDINKTWPKPTKAEDVIKKEKQEAVTAYKARLKAKIEALKQDIENDGEEQKFTDEEAHYYTMAYRELLQLIDTTD